MKARSVTNFLIIISALLYASACMPEKKLAREFINSPEKINLQVYAPEVLFKYNHKGELIKGFNRMKSDQQDSALFYTSKYVQFVDDSLYLDKYVNTFIGELRNLGFVVFLEDSADTFLTTKPQSYVINIAQVQLDEYTLPYEDSEPIGDSTYYKKFNLDAVDASSWFELSKLNIPKPKKTILFSSLTSSDAFSGYFFVDPFSQEVRYKYSIDSLKVKDLYDLAAYSGRQHADYLFDYFMNSYISIHMPQGTPPIGHFRYNRSKKTITTTDNEFFEVLDSK